MWIQHEDVYIKSQILSTPWIPWHHGLIGRWMDMNGTWMDTLLWRRWLTASPAQRCIESLSHVLSDWPFWSCMLWYAVLSTSAKDLGCGWISHVLTEVKGWHDPPILGSCSAPNGVPASSLWNKKHVTLLSSDPLYICATLFFPNA